MSVLDDGILDLYVFSFFLYLFGFELLCHFCTPFLYCTIMAFLSDSSMNDLLPFDSELYD